MTTRFTTIPGIWRASPPSTTKRWRCSSFARRGSTTIYHDLDAQKQILADAYAGHDEWKIPELLRAARADPELYFDSTSQIHMPQWHSGRVVLVGDAAHCASSLTGRGTSLALTGTYLLAQALLEHPHDHLAAFQDYERRQRPVVERALTTAAPGGDRLVPATQEALDERNKRLRAAPTH